MYLGGIASLAGSYFYESSTPTPVPAVSAVIALLCAVGAAMLGGLIYSFLTITLRTNQNVTGLTLTIFGGGVANFFGGSLVKLSGGVGQISVGAASSVIRTRIPWLSTALGTVSSVLFSYGMAYDHQKIEQKWQAYWEENKTFRCDASDFSKPKYYALDMFPYPSGVGLHDQEGSHHRHALERNTPCRMQRVMRRIRRQLSSRRPYLLSLSLQTARRSRARKPQQKQRKISRLMIWQLRARMSRMCCRLISAEERQFSRDCSILSAMMA